MWRLRLRTDRCVSAVLFTLAVCCALLLGLVLWFLLWESSSLFINPGLGAFFHARGWFPSEGSFGLLPMVWASLAIAAGALLLAVPLGLASAIYLQFYATAKLAALYRQLLHLLAGIPSVVLGLWGLTSLVPLLAKWQPPGTSLLAAIIVLAFMILPTVAITGAAALAAIPQTLLAAGTALGFTRQTSVLFIALPAARVGILNGIVLALARALGETMVMLMVAGNVVQAPDSLFAPVRALTANIALEMAYAVDEHRASLFLSGLLLTALVWWLAVTASHYKSRQQFGATYG